MQATPTDTSPISGMTALCSSGNTGTGAGLDVFPGQGPPDSVRNFTVGLTNVTTQTGQYLDNFLGVGGTGATPVSVRATPAGQPRQVLKRLPGLQASLPCSLSRCAARLLPADALQLHQARPSRDWFPGGVGGLPRGALQQHCHRRAHLLLRAWRMPGARPPRPGHQPSAGPPAAAAAQPPLLLLQPSPPPAPKPQVPQPSPPALQQPASPLPSPPPASPGPLPAPTPLCPAHPTTAAAAITTATATLSTSATAAATAALAAATLSPAAATAATTTVAADALPGPATVSHPSLAQAAHAAAAVTGTAAGCGGKTAAPGQAGL